MEHWQVGIVINRRVKATPQRVAFLMGKFKSGLNDHQDCVGRSLRSFSLAETQRSQSRLYVRGEISFGVVLMLTLRVLRLCEKHDH